MYKASKLINPEECLPCIIRYLCHTSVTVMKYGVMRTLLMPNAYLFYRKGLSDDFSVKVGWHILIIYLKKDHC